MSRLSLRKRASSFEEEGDNQVAGAGVEPASRRSERRVLPIDDPAVCAAAPTGESDHEGS